MLDQRLPGSLEGVSREHNKKVRKRESHMVVREWGLARGLGRAMLVVAIATAVSAQDTDTTPPRVLTLDFTPTTVDVRVAAATVAISARITDDLSGVQSACGYLQSPSGRQRTVRFCLFRTSGGPLDGIWIGSATIQRFVEPGIWRLWFDFLRDSAGNQGDGLVSLPSNQLTVVSDPDTEAPILTSLRILPTNELDVSFADQRFTVEMTIIDDRSGVSWADIYTAISFADMGYTQRRYAPAWTVRAGPSPNTYLVDMVMPRYSRTGFWRVNHVELRDNAGNRRIINSWSTFPILVTSTFYDGQRPRLTGFDIVPPTVDTSTAPRELTFYLNLTDDTTGIDWDAVPPNASFATGVRVRSPSKGQELIAYGNRTGAELVGGSRTNGRWRIRATLPRFAEQGDWTVDAIWVKDRVDNYLLFDRAEMERNGWPTKFVVTRPSLEPDGELSSDGGRVEDRVFGRRASLTVPPRALTTRTSVAIDVFATPPSLPRPAGYGAPGTRFVNISLTPSPAQPFPSPGLTITLPTETLLPAGSPLPLFRLDPVLGSLVPAPSVSGGFVVGTVDADGLSATFTGVARLSSVVAFLPSSVPGDANGDAKVDCSDLLIVRASFNLRRGQPGYDPRADRNSDGVVNVIDLSLVSRYIPTNLKCE